MSAVSPSGPTPQLKRHHQVEPPRIDATAFRAAWRTKSRLEGLLADKLIAPKTWLAAVEYRRLHEIAHRGALRSTADLLGKGRPPKRSGRTQHLEPTESQITALSWLATIRERLGPTVIGLIEHVVIYDRPWCQIARTMRVDGKTAKSYAIVALKSLTRA
jgi:hypothetical protein